MTPSQAGFAVPLTGKERSSGGVKTIEMKTIKTYTYHVLGFEVIVTGKHSRAWDFSFAMFIDKLINN